jgi:hypothetical protein
MIRAQVVVERMSRCLEVVLYELEIHAGVEEVGRDGVPQGMAGIVLGQFGTGPGEQSLDLVLAERASPTWNSATALSGDSATKYAVRSTRAASKRWLFAPPAI